SPKLKIAHIIGKAVWDQGGDIRDVISLGKLVRKNDGPEDIEQILSTMMKYGQNHTNSNSTSGVGSKNSEATKNKRSLFCNGIRSWHVIIFTLHGVTDIYS
ncbi:MAG TPA: hypothetical protein VEH06_12490, partial [Candidatus Bathyarchaeia archaeon]|nr:hypothetical protein [Candidatus Bathyarchaeia archaeon]